jgi:glycosyltransferase involved in cell wall biosynthesis
LRLGVIIPALDEEASIGAVIDRCRRAASSVAETRIVIADNGSADRTTEVARAAGAEVVSIRERGYGSACLAAIERLATWPDLVLFLDADGSSAPEETPRLVSPVLSGRAELSLGSRTSTEAMTLPQRWGTRLAVRLVNLIWRTHYRDMGPFRCIERRALEQLAMRDRTWGWTIEMQIKAAQNRLRVVEVPVSWNARLGGASKISGTLSGVVRAGARILWTVGRLAVTDHFGF